MDPRQRVDELLRGLGLETKLSEPELDAMTREASSSSSPTPTSLPSSLSGLDEFGSSSNEQPPDSLYSMQESLDITPDASLSEAYSAQYGVDAGARAHDGRHGADERTLSLSQSMLSDLSSPGRYTKPHRTHPTRPSPDRVAELHAAGTGDAELQQERWNVDALSQRLNLAQETITQQQDDLAELTNTCVRIRLENARLEEVRCLLACVRAFDLTAPACF